jgi:hypothetical protein
MKRVDHSKLTVLRFREAKTAINGPYVKPDLRKGPRLSSVTANGHVSPFT